MQERSKKASDTWIEPGEGGRTTGSMCDSASTQKSGRSEVAFSPVHGWPTLPRACEAVSPQAGMGVDRRVWMCADVRGCSRIWAPERRWCPIRCTGEVLLRHPGGFEAGLEITSPLEPYDPAAAQGPGMYLLLDDLDLAPTAAGAEADEGDYQVAGIE